MVTLDRVVKKGLSEEVLIIREPSHVKVWEECFWPREPQCQDPERNSRTSSRWVEKSEQG